MNAYLSPPLLFRLMALASVCLLIGKLAFRLPPPMGSTTIRPGVHI